MSDFTRRWIIGDTKMKKKCDEHIRSLIQTEMEGNIEALHERDSELQNRIARLERLVSQLMEEIAQ